jgi:cytochrome c553
MRFLVLALAILLLPLRGWLGDAMALQVLRQQVAVAAPAAHADHAMHATGGMEGVAHDHAAASTTDCQSTCTNCQLCHSVAMTVWPEVPMLAEVPRTTPAFEPAAFASAEPAPGLKPPIS